MKRLTRGMRDDDVMLMQRLLNKAARADRVGRLPLTVDGRFGPLTHDALHAFQHRRHIREAGICDGQSWHGLGVRIEYDHNHVQPMGQPTNMSCWATAAAMILGNFFPTVGTSHLTIGGGLLNTIDDVKHFGEVLGWDMPMHSPTLEEVLSWMQRTPLWIVGVGSNFAHAVALTGAWGDGTQDGTLIRIHDPWPPGATGRVYHCLADDLHEIANNGTKLPLSLQFLLVPR